VARAVIAAALLAASSARAEMPPPYGGRVVASLLSAPYGLDPVRAQSWAEVVVVGLVFDPLYRLLPDGTIAPHLAEALPVVSPDGLQMRVKLRAGVRFHDGKPVRAADAAASLTRAQKAQATEWALAPVKKIAVEGDTIVLTLKRAAPELAVRLAMPQLSVTPSGKAPGATAVGTGPFAVRRLVDAERRLELVAAPEHFAGRPYVDAISLRWFAGADDEPRAYEAGEADVSLRGPVAFAGHNPKYPTDDDEGGRLLLVYLGFGKAHPELLADSTFRKGVSLALNRAVFKNLGTGEKVVPALLPESPDLGGRMPPVAELAARPGDALDAFKRVAQRRPELEAGLAHKGSLPLELLVDETRPDDVEVAARVVAALDRAGLTVTYRALPPKEFNRRVKAGQCDLYLDQLAAPSPDALAEYAVAFAAAGDRWPMRRIEDGRFTLDTAQSAFADRLPVVPLYHRAVRAHHKRVLRHLAFDPLGRLSFADAWLLPRIPEDAP
jgi:peptide/nickel transport system substrate-binding protein